MYLGCNHYSCFPRFSCPAETVILDFCDEQRVQLDSSSRFGHHALMFDVQHLQPNIHAFALPLLRAFVLLLRTHTPLGLSAAVRAPLRRVFLAIIANHLLPEVLEHPVGLLDLLPHAYALTLGEVSAHLHLHLTELYILLLNLQFLEIFNALLRDVAVVDPLHDILPAL